jgi:signal peptide peptidase SppA
MSEHFLPHLAQQVLRQPLLIHPDKLAIIAEVLGGRIGIDTGMLKLGPDASRFVGRRRDTETGEYLYFARTDDGAAIVTITGSLVNRGAWVGASSGLTSYEGIKQQLAAAAADGKVRSIVLDMETPGGLALGMPEAAAAVRAAAAVKPVIAVVNGMAASAGYGIASGATRIVTTPSGIAGSIGVKMLHVDYSRMLDRAGVTPTMISAPDDGSKTLGNPFQPLSDADEARLKAEIDAVYAQFLDTIVAGRTSLTREAIRALGAHVYSGQAAVDAGLADELGTFETVLTNFSRGAPRRPSRSTRMSADDDLIYSRADLNQARHASHAAGVAEGREAALKPYEGKTVVMLRAEGATAERERLAAILCLDESKGREASAQKLALTTDMPVDAAKALLATLPIASPARPLATRAAEVPPAGAAADDRSAKLSAEALSPAAIYAARRRIVEAHAAD